MLRQRAVISASERQAAKQNLSQAQEISKTTIRPGSFNVRAIFLGLLPPRKGAASTAAAGQGGNAGGGQGPKQPPVTIQVILLDIDKLAEKQLADADYRIVSSDQISIIARDSKAIGDCKKAIEKAEGAHRAANVKMPPDPAEVESTKQVLEACRRAYDQAVNHIEHLLVDNEGSALVSTFAREKAKECKQGQLIQLLGLRGDTNVSTKDGKRYTNLVAAGITIEPIPKDSNVFCELSKLMDITQRPIYPPPSDTENYQKRTFLLNFQEFMRTEEETKGERGPVKMRILENSDNVNDWKKVPQDGSAATLRGSWRMTVGQDLVGVPEHRRSTFPVGNFQVVVTFVEGAWTEQTNRTTLREGFGINDADIFAEIMAVNPVSGLLACSDNLPTTSAQNVGETDFEREAGKIYYWGNSGNFDLRTYLLEECPQVSVDYARFLLGLNTTDPLQSILIQTENPDRPNLLNRKNTRQGYNDEPPLVLVNGKCVCLTGGYNGKLIDLIRQGAQFRVMHSAPLKAEDRLTIAKMPTEDAEKCIDRARDAKIRFPKPPNCVVYAVVPYSEAEIKYMLECDATWKTRKEHRAKVQAEIDKRDAAIKEEQDKADLAAMEAFEEAQRATDALNKAASAKAAGQPVLVAPAAPPSQTSKRERSAGEEEDGDDGEIPEEDSGEAKAMDQGDDDDQDPESEPEPVAKKPAITKKAVPAKKVIAPASGKK